jgi:hypothetical protein
VKLHTITCTDAILSWADKYVKIYYENGVSTQEEELPEPNAMISPIMPIGL